LFSKKFLYYEQRHGSAVGRAQWNFLTGSGEAGVFDGIAYLSAVSKLAHNPLPMPAQVPGMMNAAG
jgi:hypothetical protein